MMVPAKIDDECRPVEINNEFYVRLSQFAELVYIGIENRQSDNGTSSLDEFYRGMTNISWQMLAKNTVGMRPSIYNECKTKLLEIYKKMGSSRIKFYYKRGMGGTTCIRQLAYDIHENYPTIIITSYTQDSTADEIQKLYNLCKMPIVIFIDSNNLYNEEVEKLHRELKSRTFSFTIVHLIGVFEEYPKYHAYPKLVKFSKEDFNQLCTLLNNNIQEETKYQERLNEIRKRNDVSNMSPFLLNLHVFEERFEGIDNFVQNTLSFPNLEGQMRDQIENLKNVLFVTALASWAGFSVEEQFFSDAYGHLFTRRLKQLESPLAPLIVFETMGDSGHFRIRHFQFSKSILKIFSESNDNISFTKLTQRIVDFIRVTRKEDTKTKQEATLRLLVRLFINRDWDVSDVTESVSTRNQEVYSSLIKKLIDEKKHNSSAQEMVYTPESDSIIRIYRTLTKCYPEEIHFHAHLARYYFYTAKDYENGFATVENAIKLAEESIEYDAAAVALVYHIKGMGYRSYINHLITSDLSVAMKQIEAYDANKRECSNQILKAIHKIQSNAQNADECFEASGKLGDNNLIYSLISSCQMRIQIQRSYNTLRNLSSRLGLNSFVTDDHYIMNQTVLHNKNEELQAWAVFFEGNDESYTQRQEETTKKISNIDVDVRDLTEENSDTIKYCLQCLENDAISDKSIYRQVIARKKYDEISTDFSSAENQKTLLEIIDLYESNIEENGGTRADICNWFTAKCQLDINKEIAIDVLEECEHKFDSWIEAGNTTRDIHLYRYIVHFLKYYEMNSLKSAESQKVLKELEAELKKRSTALVNKTAMVYWVGNVGYGLRRLISNRLFKQLSSDDKIRTLQMFEGKLPQRENFSQNTAYIYCSGQHVFFRPSAIKGRLSKDNADDFVSLGVGFSYDGLRSYHDSIVRITKMPLSISHSTGDNVTVKVIKHNTSWVECMIVDEDQPVIISKYDLKKPFDPEYGIWPKQNSLLDVILLEQCDYELRGRYYDEHHITKKTYRAELL